MSDQSLLLGLPFIQTNQAQKHVTHNEALRALDVLVQLGVASQSQTTPPVTPQIGDCYIVADGASAAWAGQDRAIAIWDGTAWQFYAPMQGWRAWVADAHAISVFDDGAWALQQLDPQQLDGVGVGTTSDPINRLSVAAHATLLTHDGAGHQVKVNKASAADTASLLFQNGYSGRAEMGLAGTDLFSIKTSADGSSWANALVVDGAGKVGVGQTPVGEALEVAGNVLADGHLTPSDRRLKTAIQPAAEAGAAIDALRVVSFDWISGGSVRFGLIAQEVAEVLPEVVAQGTQQPWAIDNAQLVPLLLQELQSLRARVATLETGAG